MVTEPSGWREPTSLLPLRWGTYRGRYLAGLLLIVGGLLSVAGADTHKIPMLLLGTTAHVTGWFILPAGGARRIWVVGPSLAAAWILLTGPQSLWILLPPYLAWLVVRHRPLRSYVTALLILANAIVTAHIFQEYSGMPYALAISAVVFVGSAWLARWIAGVGRLPRRLSAALPRPNSG